MKVIMRVTEDREVPPEGTQTPLAPQAPEQAQPHLKHAQHRRAREKLRLQIVRRWRQPGFVVLARRWSVERPFGWLLRHRRLVRAYAYLP